MKYFEKTSDLKDWWENRKEDYEYAKMLAKHKYLVYKGGKEIGAPTMDLLKHDWSKFKPSIWTPYREAVIDERVFEVGPENIDPKVWQDFRKAVLKHVDSETHHDYKYKNRGEPNLENYADWYAVTKANNSDTPNIKTWLKRKNLLTN